MTVAILLFVILCLPSSIRLICDAPNPFHITIDDVARRSDQRFAAMKAILPSRGVVGYMGASGNTGTEDYYLAQYALAPLVLDRSANHPYVIANFPNATETEAPSDLRSVRDFGGGLYLFATKDAQ